MAGLSAWAASNLSAIPTNAGQDLYQKHPGRVDQAIIRTLSAMATVVALTCCHKNGKEFVPADPKRSFVENVVLMMGRLEEGSTNPDPRIVRCLERLWILCADHEMSNSTAAFLHASSTFSDPLSCCVAGVASGSGPLHAGAIDLAYTQLERIGTIDKVPELIARVKAGKQRLFGYGHRLYKIEDPRFRPIASMMHELTLPGQVNPLLSVALEIDRIASQDEYFINRHLHVNADLYGCLVYTALYV